MAHSPFLYTIVLFVLIFAKSLLTSWMPPEEKKNVEFEFLKKLEKQRIRALILEELGLDEPPNVTSESNSSTGRLPEGVIRLLLQKKDHPASSVIKHRKNIAQLLFHSTNENHTCQRYHEESCRRFEYNLPTKMVYVTSEFLMYRIKRLQGENQTILALCSHAQEGKYGENQLEHIEFVMDDGEEKWMSFELPTLEKLEFLTDLTCAVEVTGAIIDEKENLPLLKIIQDLEVHKRNRRSNSSFEACKPIPFDVSFNEIGFTNHFSYPDSFGAFVCKGKCWKSPNFYETIMDLVFQGNSTLEEQYGRCWETCCRPTEYENMDVIFRSIVNNTEVHNVTTLTDIIVKSCACR